MIILNRRHALGLIAAGTGSVAMPGLLRAQGARPSITIAVQKITNNNTLDPWNEQSNVGERVFFPNLWESLIGRDWMGTQGPVPSLATDWKRLDDRTMELKLREGVRFHNGDEMTAEDVAFSFSPERVFADTQPVGGKTIFAEDYKPATAKDLPPNVPGIGRRLWPALEGVEIVDKYTVRFHNATPDVTMEGRLYSFGSQIASRRAWDEAASYAEWAAKPVTTGAYMVEEHRPDVSLTLVAFDDHWEGRPPLERITFVEVPEVSSRVNGLLSGEYDFACDLPPDQIGNVQGQSGFEVQSSTIWNHRISVFNTQNDILADPLVRRAMTHSIDRDAIVQALWGGMTNVPAGLQFESFRASNMFVEGWAAPEFNPELARDLLKQANYKGDPIPYRLLNNYYTNQVSNGQIMVEMWKQVGLNVQIEMKENWGQIHDPEGIKGVRDWSASNTINDPITPMVVQFGPNGEVQQKKDWSNAELNELSVVMETSTDQAKRKQAITRMLEIAEREDPAYQVLHQNAVFTGMRSDLNWKAAPAFAMDFRASNWNASQG
ncbi:MULTISPECIES: ABC transporter substrate-binding protein [Salipiger]|jgi:peptide/nickel transport system substrate-binding protein|uniref:ABC transporter substrate-binding protein n=1 Tax=Salipiger TaxID=263377 RepID=UPI0001B8C85B|nr:MULTISPECIES: ABC transporter substrate-binding protein [Salipiger]EEX12370.1 twin-arginine translocation pathway signal [Citreicella sp. SE45]MAU47120.1 ABC transporter substrate-binding protein [Salipiger sp.]MBR9840092.1 ABC transporter substrate-binding protein [Paracoccaceae bacterium]MCA0848559.1 ABC transporter substrate-binding protein [Salipiger thiooxidans]NIY95428.1 ABC transporter substrate-binding protein [Salipiger sp. HF18]